MRPAKLGDRGDEAERWLANTYVDKRDKVSL